MVAVAALYLVIKMQKAAVVRLFSLRSFVTETLAGVQKWPNMERKPWWAEFMVGVEEEGNLKGASMSHC